MPRNFKKLISLFISFCFIFEQSVFAQSIDLSHYFIHNPAQAIQSDKFRPLHLRYLGYDNLNNDFKILLDKGDTRKEDLENKDYIEKNTQTLLKYFFIGLALPNEKFWVNLRPDAPDNIIDDDLAQTDVGKILLEADLQLKKDTASFTSPQTKEGKEYWDKLYKKAGELFGTENITIPTITRPWIVPDEIILRESPDTSAYIYKATLKVMLEEDYLNNQKTEKQKNIKTEVYNFQDPRLKEVNQYSTQLIKETIIPRLTQEINSSKRYALLRQVYYSLILAQHFKKKFSQLTGENPYTKLIDSRNLTNLTSKEPWDKLDYFKEYQKSFQEGEYNLSEPVYTPYGQSVRKYMSGGVIVDIASSSVKIAKVKANRELKLISSSALLGPIKVKGPTVSRENIIPVPAPYGFKYNEAGENGSSSSLEEANIPKLADDVLERILWQDELSEADIKTLFRQIPIFLVKKYHLVKSFKFDPIIDGIKAKLREQLGADIYERRLMGVVMNSKKILYTNKAKEIFKERMELLKKVLALSKTNLVTIKEIEHENKGKRTIQTIDGHALPTKFLQIIALTIYDIMRENFKNKIEGMELFGSVAKEKAKFGSDIDGRLYLKESASKDYSEIEYVKSTIVWFIREIIKEENFSGEHIKILVGESRYSFSKVEAREAVEYYRESLEKIREILKDKRMVSSSLTAGDQELGGIDLTSLPITTQSLLNQHLTANMSIVSSALNLNINLDNELKQIQDMLKAGIMPSSERIKEYALVSSSLKPEDYNREIDKILGCIADVFRLEEEKAKPTPQVLKDMLIRIESDNPAPEL